MPKWFIELGQGQTMNYIIVGFAGFCLAAFVGSIILSNNINKQMSAENEPDYKTKSFNWLNLFYNIFLVIVSIFPLLGMLGTVLALLGLDFSSPDTAALKQQFSVALETTALGLIFSIVFKIVHAPFQSRIETAIDKIDEITKKSFK
ncbi:MAG: MotA/TolQ/ExbB proton channel family protein [Bacteroides sp.]|nr:MotA/TolQ/ExbB proton channel family protein [Roseburia sp.]MCM1463683.1 MotA/TolQ/ExbB proton channel family protein [Bacteroides sp.]